jgi:hypothetical protein
MKQFVLFIIPYQSEKRITLNSHLVLEKRIGEDNSNIAMSLRGNSFAPPGL